MHLLNILNISISHVFGYVKNETDYCFCSEEFLTGFIQVDFIDASLPCAVIENTFAAQGTSDNLMPKADG